MPKLVVAVKSCQRDRKLGFHDAIRSTWGMDLRNLGIDVKFFMGHSGINAVKGHMQTNDTREALTLQKDETFIDAPDDYDSLPFKTRAICKWVADRVIDKLFLCDNDTFIYAKTFAKLPYNDADYAGQLFTGGKVLGQTFFYKDAVGEYPACYPWASGGDGYFLSKRAAGMVADTFPKVWAEDMYVGQVLGPEIARGKLVCEPLSLKGATKHHRKTAEQPNFTVAMLYQMYKDANKR